MLSKCPNCRSRFEIGEAQLAAANGLVRCGACLHVFNGIDEAVDVPLSKERIEGIDRELEAIEAQINAIENTRSVPKKSKSIDDELADFSANLSTSIGNERFLPEDIDTFDIINGKPEQFSSTHYIESSWDDNQTNPMYGEASHANTSYNTKKSKISTMPKKRNKLEDDINDFFAVSDVIQHEGSSPQAFKTNSLRPSAKDGFSKSKAPPLSSLSINDEPLHLSTQAPDNNKSRLWVYLGGLFVVGLASGAGYLVVNFQTLALDPQWREPLEKACAFFPCELPPTYSTQFLKVMSRSYREDGTNLIVDAVIFNTNPNFDMPFPHLIMKFTDLNDKTVAEFKVTPAEYRQGELALINQFPKNTSAHIQFTIPNPNEDNLSFTITFQYPKQ